MSGAAEDPARLLNNREVVRLCKAGVSEEVVIARVRRNGKAFDLNTDEIIELRRSGVSETVIKYLVDPTLPYSPPSPSPAPPPSGSQSPSVSPSAARAPLDPLAAKLPAEAGIYYLKGQEFVVLDLKLILPSKRPGKLSALSGGLLKGHVVGSVIGPAAKTRTKGGSSIFYARLNGKVTIDDLELLTFGSSTKRRDLDFGTKPGKPVFPVKAVEQFESKEVGPGLFRLVVALNHSGEYLFFVIGSGDDKRGLLGKGYDFGVD